MANVKWDVNINVKSESAKTGATEVKKLGKSLTEGEKAVKALQKELNALKVPGEIKRLQHEIGELNKKTTEHAQHGAGLFSRLARVLTLNAAGFHHISLAAGEAHAKTSEFLEFIGAEAALDVLKEIAAKLMEIGEEAVKSAAKAERMNRVFAIQQGGKEQGKAAQEWVEKFSKTSEFSEAANESAFVGLRKQGVNSQHAGLIMKASADIAAGSEDKNAAYQEAISAFERIQQTGRVNARMLRPLGIGVEDFKKMPEFKGMTNEKVNEALGKKNVDENELFQLIMAHAGEKKLGTRSYENVDLLQTKMEKLQELPERFFKKLGDTKSVGMLAHALDGVLTKLDPDSPTGAKVFGALEHAMESIAGTIDEIDFGSIADTLRTDVIPAIETMISLIKPTMELITTTIHGFGVAAHFISGRKTGVEQAKAEQAYNSNAAAGGIMAQLKAPFLSADAGVEKAHDTTANTLPYGLPAHYYAEAKAVAAGAAKGVKDGTPKYQDAVTGMSQAGSDTFTSENEIQSPSKLFQRHGEMLSAGVAVGVKKGTTRIEDAMATSFQVPSGGASTAVGGAAGGITVSLQTTIYVNGGEDGEAQGKKAGDAFNARVRAEVTRVLEQAMAGGGG